MRERCSFPYPYKLRCSSPRYSTTLAPSYTVFPFNIIVRMQPPIAVHKQWRSIAVTVWAYKLVW